MRNASVLVRSKTSRNIGIVLLAAAPLAIHTEFVAVQLFIGAMCTLGYWARFGSARPRKAKIAASLVAALVILTVAKLATRFTMTIAKDGLLLDSIRRTRFIRFGDIDGVHRVAPRRRTTISPGFVAPRVTGLPRYAPSQKVAATAMRRWRRKISSTCSPTRARPMKCVRHRPQRSRR